MGLRSAHGHTPAALKRTPPPPLRHKLICPGCNRRFFGLRSDAIYCSTTCRMRGHRNRLAKAEK